MKNVKLALLMMFCIVSSTLSIAAPPPPPKDNKPLAEQCRRIALTLDALGRYQDRSICTNLLSGFPVYNASSFILNNQYVDASALLKPVIVQINFAVDIGCYGQDDMKKAAQDIQTVLTAITN